MNDPKKSHLALVHDNPEVEGSKPESTESNASTEEKASVQVVSHELNSARHHVRVRMPAKAIIGEITYDVADWSLGGIAVDGLLPNAETGNQVQVRVSFPFENFNFSLEIPAVVVWCNPSNKKTGLRFLELKAGQTEMLRHLSVSYLSGAVATVDGMLLSTQSPKNRKPVQTGNLIEMVNLGPKDKAIRAGKTILRFSLWAVLAVSVLGAIGTGLYSRMFIVQPTQAVTFVDLIRVKAPVASSVQRLEIVPGNEVQAGSVVAILEDPKISGAIQIARANLSQEQTRVANLQKQLQEYQWYFGEHQRLSKSKVKALAEERVRLKKTLDIAKRQLAVASKLRSSGGLTRIEVDESKKKVVKAESELQALEQAWLEASSIEKMAASGHYPSVSKSGTDVAAISREIDLARRAVELADAKLKSFTSQASALLVKSPCNCVVEKVNVQVGDWLNGGAVVATFRPQEVSHSKVVALVSLADASRLQAGGRAFVRLPERDKTFSGAISEVKTLQAEGEMDFGLRVPAGEAMALVSITLDEQITELTHGIPAEVRLKVTRWPSLFGDFR